MPYFCRKLGKVLQNLSSAAVMIGTFLSILEMGQYEGEIRKFVFLQGSLSYSVITWAKTRFYRKILYSDTNYNMRHMFLSCSEN